MAGKYTPKSGKGKHGQDDPEAKKVGRKWGTEPKQEKKPPKHRKG